MTETEVSTDPQREETRYAACSAAVLNARRDMAQALRRWGLPELVGPVGQVVSELVANAVQHTSSRTVGISITRTDEVTVRLMVMDSSRRLPQTGTPTPGAEGGRGLLLVAAFADRWGVTPVHGGKRVWAVLKAATR
ncbi:ATP-binding protein [Streptomyces sp. NPDC005283]|uniref:ATP-binding protein n=1 Tax=Streptomyces sp. NPDC005283 TaxID=3156871 RepID=UPI0034550207